MLGCPMNQPIKDLPVISAEMQDDILRLAAAQIIEIGRTLSCAATMVCSVPLSDERGKKALDYLLKDAYEINGLIGLMMITNERLAGTLCESSRKRLKNLCQEAIENAGKSGGEK